MARVRAAMSRFFFMAFLGTGTRRYVHEQITPGGHGG
jgi:hypothetical protein